MRSGSETKGTVGGGQVQWVMDKLRHLLIFPCQTPSGDRMPCPGGRLSLRLCHFEKLSVYGTEWRSVPRRCLFLKQSAVFRRPGGPCSGACLSGSAGARGASRVWCGESGREVTEGRPEGGACAYTVGQRAAVASGSEGGLACRQPGVAARVAPVSQLLFSWSRGCD